MAVDGMGTSDRPATVSDIAQLLDLKLMPITTRLADHDAKIAQNRTQIGTVAATVEGALQLAKKTDGKVAELSAQFAEFSAKLDKAQTTQANMDIGTSRVITTTTEGDEIRAIAVRIRLEFPRKVEEAEMATAVNAALAPLNATLSDLSAEIEKTFDPAHLQGTVAILKFAKGSEARKEAYNLLAPINHATKQRESQASFEGGKVAVKMLKTKRELSTLSLLYEGKKKLQQDTGETLMVDAKEKTVKDQSGKVRAFIKGDSLVMPAGV